METIEEFFSHLHNEQSLKFFQNKEGNHNKKEHQLNMGISSHKCKKHSFNFQKFDEIRPVKLKYIADMEQHKHWFQPIAHYRKYNNIIESSLKNVRSSFMSDDEEFYIEN